jgi:hypothetical protein
MPRKYTQRQMTGTEYSGVERTVATVQPKAPEALTNGEKLRLFYLTGQMEQTEGVKALEDHRQMLGLLPADGRKPVWLSETGAGPSQAEIEHPELFE